MARKRATTATTAPDEPLKAGAALEEGTPPQSCGREPGGSAEPTTASPRSEVGTYETRKKPRKRGAARSPRARKPKTASAPERKAPADRQAGETGAAGGEQVRETRQDAAEVPPPAPEPDVRSGAAIPPGCGDASPAEAVTASAEAAQSTTAAPSGSPCEPAREASGDDPVELSAEEALALLAAAKAEKTEKNENAPQARPVAESSGDACDASSSGGVPAPVGPSGDAPRAGASGRVRARLPLGAPCRVIAFESPSVEPAMRVAGTTVARLYSMIRDGELDLELGPICQSPEEFVAAWDRTSEDVHAIVLANLNGAGGFLETVSALRPGVAGAYWVVYETLRSEVSSATSGFLAELRSRNRARAIGYGPRNVVEAARRGAEAVRGHVEWGFGRSHLAAAS